MRIGLLSGGKVGRMWLIWAFKESMPISGRIILSLSES